MYDSLRSHGLYSLGGSSIHGIFQARGLEWGAISFSRGFSQSRDRTQLSHITGRLFTNWATSSGQFSCSFVSNSLQPQGPQHARPPCPSSTPRVYSNSCPLSWWWHPTISASVTPFSSCLQSFLASRSFPMSVRLIRWSKFWSFSFSFSISPSSEYSGLISFRMDWFDLLAVQGTLKSLIQHHSSKASILWLLAFFMVQLSRSYMTTEKL